MCVSLVNQSFFRGFTIFPMKRTVRVNLSRISSRKGLLNLTRGGRGKSPDLQVTSFTVAPDASVPFSWTFSMALWITCKEESRQPPGDNPARREQPATLFTLASQRLEQDWAAAASGKLPLQHQQPSHHSSHPSLLVQTVALKLQAAKEWSRWLMTRKSGSKETW